MKILTYITIKQKTEGKRTEHTAVIIEALTISSLESLKICHPYNAVNWEYGR